MFVVSPGVGEGERPRGRLAGPDRGLEGAAVVPGRRPVIGELRPVAGGDRAAARDALRQGLGERAMEPLPLARQEVVVGGLLEQRVAERVVAVGAVAAAPVDQHLAADGRPQGVEQVRVVHARRPARAGHGRPAGPRRRPRR